MKISIFFISIFLILSCSQKRTTTDDSSDKETNQNLLTPYFPTRMHAFIWRNWESVSLDRIAKVLNTTSKNVNEAGLSMGLPPHIKPGKEFVQRGYISLIRRNWHLISYNQLLTLLDWDSAHLDETLRDDDFLAHKVGGMKPDCSDVKFITPNTSTKKRCAEIKKIVEDNFGDELNVPQEKRFQFIKNLSEIDKNIEPVKISESAEEDPIRFVYSYFAPFGDPLLNPELDPFPEGLLQRLNKQGINGVWLHVTLHQLTSSKIFPELGADHETRLKNLRKLAKRTQKYGIKIYLYMNEPRGMPLSFFEGREDLMGVEKNGIGSLCTSVPIVNEWLKESLTNVFSEVPELGGVFTISGSENLTNCWSWQHGDKCPRCSKREPAVVIAEVNKTIAEGVWQGNPNAKVIVWDWGWPDGSAWGKNRWADDIIKLLPDNVYHMSVSEWSKPLNRGGIDAKVGEYSISVVGPGPRALHLWELAKKRNLKTIAKIQVNNTWELSAIPYLPVMNLVAEHIKNLQNENVDGLMLSWSLGGYPSPNIQLVKLMQDNPSNTISESLNEIATKRYGKKSAPEVLKAWEIFGVSNPFYKTPTGKAATMLGFSYDDLEHWRGIYPADILGSQFTKLANEWEKGLPHFEKAVELAETPSQKTNAIEDLRFATAGWIHYKSVANQIHFIMARDKILSGELSQKESETEANIFNDVVNDEIDLAKQIYKISKEDSRIGFEASNHYYYFPLDFVEKVINCEYILDSN